jgi:hypothetical protein
MWTRETFSLRGKLRSQRGFRRISGKASTGMPRWRALLLKSRSGSAGLGLRSRSIAGSNCPRARMMGELDSSNSSGPPVCRESTVRIACKARGLLVSGFIYQKSYTMCSCPGMA